LSKERIKYFFDVLSKLNQPIDKRRAMCFLIALAVVRPLILLDVVTWGCPYGNVE